jgi:hypothetical protein
LRGLELGILMHFRILLGLLRVGQRAGAYAL